MIAERSPRNHETSQTLENFLAFCRWFSAFIVILSHTRALSFVGYDALHRTWASKLLLPLYVIGAMADEAVIVFFVLSGFLVGGRAAERALGGRFKLKDYAIDRSTRIYCVLIPALALTLVFDLLGSRWLAGSGLYDATSPILHGRFDLPFQDALGTGTLICNLLSAQPYRCSVYGSNIPLWSLSYEVWFYACAGACCYLAELLSCFTSMPTACRELNSNVRFFSSRASASAADGPTGCPSRRSARIATQPERRSQLRRKRLRAWASWSADSAK